MNALFLTAVQVVSVLLLAPFATGLVRWFKARLQGRCGASPFLPYWTLLTLFKKEFVRSRSTSWVFRFVPFMVLGSALFLVLVLPLLGQGTTLYALGDFVVVAAVLVVGAVFLVLGGLDSASAFGGMGSEREMTLVALMEPALITVFAAFAHVSGSSTVDGFLSAGGMNLGAYPGLILSLGAFLLVALAENARYPVDNPATHLELTMVHEAMVLEYSGPYLALLEYASSLKLITFTLLIGNLLLPGTLLLADAGMASLIIALLWLMGKVVVGMALLALLETSIAKMRFYRMQELSAWAFFLALAGLMVVLFPSV